MLTLELNWSIEDTSRQNLGLKFRVTNTSDSPLFYDRYQFFIPFLGQLFCLQTPDGTSIPFQNPYRRARPPPSLVNPDRWVRLEAGSSSSEWAETEMISLAQIFPSVVSVECGTILKLGVKGETEKDGIGRVVRGLRVEQFEDLRRRFEGGDIRSRLEDEEMEMLGLIWHELVIELKE